MKPGTLTVKPHPDDEAEVCAAFEDEDDGVVVTAEQLDAWAETGAVPWDPTTPGS